MAIMSGFLRRTETGVIGEMVDAFGYITRITGVPGVLHGVRGYTIEATVVIPEGLKIPFVDDETS